MGPLDRYAFRVVVSLALHGTLAVVAVVGAAVLAFPHPLVASLLGLVAAANGLLGLRAHYRLMSHLQARQVR
ncbi:MAG: hypothetical protein AAGA48_04715 [Myxococcota bacterium]